MISSPDDAGRLLEKWKTDNTLLQIAYTGNGIILKSACVVTGFSSSEMSLAWETGGMTVSLEGASFEYSEPREAPIPIKTSSEAKYICCLGVSTPLGEQFGLYELRFE